MSLALQLANLSTRLGTEFKSVRGSIGTLTSLTTTEKTTIVGAVNELRAGLAAGGTVTADAITDAGTIGKDVLRSTTQGAARTAIGAGTSNLALGTTSATAKAGDYQPTWAQVTAKPAFLAEGTTAALARSAIGAGTSNLVVGTASTDAKAGDYQPTWAQVTSKPAFIAAGADQASARAAIGAGTSDLALGTTGSTAKAGNYAPTWTEVTSKPAFIAAGADPAAARAVIGAGTSDLVLGTTGTTAKAGNYTPAWVDISSKPTVIAAGVDAAAARSVISVLSSGEVDSRISAVVGTAPAALDTLGEIATQLAADASSIGTIITGLANRVRVDASQAFTEPEKLQARSNIDVYSKAEIGNPEANLVTIFEAALV